MTTWSARLATFAILLSLVGIPLSAQAPRQTLTLAQAVGEALIRNDRMLNQNDSTEQADLSVRLARNAFRPKIVPNIQGSFGQTNVSNQNYRVDLTQRLSTGTEFRVGIGASTAQIPNEGGGDLRYYNTDTTLAVNQPLLRGFGPTVTRRNVNAAQVRRDGATRQTRMTEQQLTIEVAAAYYRLVAQRALVDVAEKSLDRARRLREASEGKLDAGLVSQLDLFRAQQLVTQSEIQLFDAQGATEDAHDQLSFLMGRELASTFDVVAEIPQTPESLETDRAVTIALDRRLDLQNAIAEAADAEQATGFARNQLLPQLDFSLAMTRRETPTSLFSSFGLDHFQFATFFTMSMPVDRTPQQIEYQTALIERDRRRREIETIRKRIADDVRRALRSRDRVFRTLAAAELGVQIGQREVEVAQSRYERGLSNNLDVVTAETNLLNAESRRILALAESAVTRLSLRATLGILDPRQDVDESNRIAKEDGTP